MSGRVKYFSSEKGFGFIIPDEDGYEPIFVHQTEIKARGFRSLAEDERVEFEVRKQSDGRFKAFGVTGPDGDYCKGIPEHLRDTRDDGRGDDRGRDDRRGGRRDYDDRGGDDRRGGYDRRVDRGGYDRRDSGRRQY